MKITNKVFKKLFAGGIIFCLILVIAASVNAQTWIQLSPTSDPQYGFPAPRDNHTAVYNASTNRMIIFAGSTSVGGYGIVNDVWVLTHADGTGGTPAWIKLNPSGGPPSPRSGQIAVYDQAANRMIIQGGHTMPGYCEGVVGDTWVLTNADGTGGTPQWIPLASGPANISHSAVYDTADNRLIVWGYHPTACGAPTDQTFIFTNANGLGGTGQWINLLPSNPVTFTQFANGPIGYDPDTNTLIALARDGANYPEPWHNAMRLLAGANGLETNAAWYDITFNGIIPHALGQSGVYNAGRNSMLIACGIDYSGEALAYCTSWRLDNANGQGGTPLWTQLNPEGTIPPGRTSGTAVYNSLSNRMTIFGGSKYGASPHYNDVWVLTEAMGPPPNQAPVALCQGITVTAGSSCNASASIDNGSYDPDGDPITLVQSPAGPYYQGDTSVTLTVSDDKGASSQCTGTVTVNDNDAPTISGVSASPSILWPPNNKMTTVQVNYSADDNCDTPTCSLSSVTSNEPISSSDYTILDAHHVKLIAQRLGSGSGRIYNIGITCTDSTGNSSDTFATVTVPHDQGKK